MPQMSLREYARHRGCALSAVQKAIAKGRITRLENGKVDAAAADQQWAANTNAAKRNVEHTPVIAPLLGGEPVTAPAVVISDELRSLPFGKLPEKAPQAPLVEKPSEPVVAIDGFMAAKTRRELAEAELAEQKLDEARKRVLPAEAVRRRFTELGRLVATAHAQLPSQLALALMGKSGLRELEEAIREFVRQMDERIADECEQRVTQYLAVPGDESERRSAVA